MQLSTSLDRLNECLLNQYNSKIRRNDSMMFSRNQKLFTMLFMGLLLMLGVLPQTAFAQERNATQW